MKDNGVITRAEIVAKLKARQRAMIERMMEELKVSQDLIRKPGKEN